MDKDSLLSFEVTPGFVDPFTDGNDVPDSTPEPNSIWDKLLVAIRKIVKNDGIRADSIQPGQIEEQVSEDAVAHIYHDVTEFYDWYFNPDDDRKMFLEDQKKVDIPTSLKMVVQPVVEDNLDAMREVDEIPQGQDTDGLEERLTDSLSRYILNWQDWYYDRKEDEEVDAYFEQKSFYDDIYLDSDYGYLGNLLDDGQFDGISDVPYIAEEL